MIELPNLFVLAINFKVESSIKTITIHSAKLKKIKLHLYDNIMKFNFANPSIERIIICII